MPLIDPVPSSSFDVLERNIQDTDKFVNQEAGTLTNRVGKVIKPIPVIESEANAAIGSLISEITNLGLQAVESVGWTPVGEFATGFTYTKLNDVGRDALGSWWRYNGSDLPKVIAAGTVPSSPDFSVISFETAYNVEWEAGKSVGYALDTIKKLFNLDSYESLRTYTGDASVVYVLGRVNNQDGAAGHFAVDATDITSVDNDGTILVDTTGRRWKRQRSGHVNVDMFGAVGDAVNNIETASVTGTDSAPAFQKLATLCDQGAAYWHIDAFDKDYRINSTIKFKQPSVNIFGTSGARALVRGTPVRKGNIYIDRGVTRAFDLGDGRTDGNPADNWTIKGISLKAVWADASCDGFVFTTATDGPDRGIVIQDCSATYLKNAISFPSRGTSISAATVEIKNCTLIANDYGVAAEYGNVTGIAIVSNQIEQNTKGGIKGSFNGPVYIADNMLEGQPDAITLEYPEAPTSANVCDAKVTRNYFESNTGSHSVKLFAGSQCALTVENNFWSPSFPTDKIVITGAATVRLNVNEQLFDDVKVTFTDYMGVIDYGSNFLNNKTNSFLVRKLTTGYSPAIITSDYQNFQSETLFAVNSQETGSGHYPTPYGDMACADVGESIRIPINVVAGQLFALNVFCRIDDGTIPAFTLWNSDKTSILLSYSAFNNVSFSCNGRWSLVTIPIIANQTTSEMFFEVVKPAESVGKFLVAGVAQVNYGAFTNDGSMTASIAPVMPSRVINQIGSNYTQTAVSGGTSIVDTGITGLKANGSSDSSSVYDVIVTGYENASVNDDQTVSTGVILINRFGGQKIISYSEQFTMPATGGLSASAVWWDGAVESVATSNELAQIRIKISGYLSNTGYEQECRLSKRM